VKFLTDVQARISFVWTLRQLGHEVTTAHEQNLDQEKDDSKLVARAHVLGAVFLTFDDLRAQSGMRVAREIAVNGGRAIRIGGGPDQPDERALGRLLFHWPEWYPKLKRNDGLVEISDIKQSIRWYPRGRIRMRVRPIDQPAFDEYLREREAARKKPLKRSRRRRRDPRQAEFNVNSGAA
jgi:hypothetical protein